MNTNHRFAWMKKWGVWLVVAIALVIAVGIKMVTADDVTAGNYLVADTGSTSFKKSVSDVWLLVDNTNSNNNGNNGGDNNGNNGGDNGGNNNGGDNGNNGNNGGNLPGTGGQNNGNQTNNNGNQTTGNNGNNSGSNGNASQPGANGALIVGGKTNLPSTGVSDSTGIKVLGSLFVGIAILIVSVSQLNYKKLRRLFL
ncbi:hypothetical protein [Lacticaseibacillus saniviri]|uniref:Uncharacterized protein n=1 Tax=Lacticaseibacillus saniviri JCM 17471 = DSM 24301 TaxID=1293598 RepID=A0A0R2MTE2_9LACO|nr:hypothetical protein [Lacticaseibacillus saniviri]KRO16888.1 hypothetical protein IV56_GL000574 [Lacticaseibacillus saniviri JCM 17471 = DSM 24301]